MPHHSRIGSHLEHLKKKCSAANTDMKTQLTGKHLNFKKGREYAVLDF